MYLEVSTHCLLSGRGRKNVKSVESATRTAVYFPPPFPRVYNYTPEGARRRHPDEIFITGSNKEDVIKAEMAFNSLVSVLAHWSPLRHNPMLTVRIVVAIKRLLQDCRAVAPKN
jgi:hypothetical protein